MLVTRKQLGLLAPRGLLGRHLVDERALISPKRFELLRAFHTSKARFESANNHEPKLPLYSLCLTYSSLLGHTR
ncbi:hypothetical protein DENSPDRAFT_714596 [Dentipellis sp. KUC8613]|nr:hypothetical protein DENSPDRAFT_714596 [Dentipellis sp. KUC8613]